MAKLFLSSKSGHPVPRRRLGESVDSPSFYREFKAYVAAELTELLTRPGGISTYMASRADSIVTNFLATERLPSDTSITDLFARCCQDVRISGEEYFKLFSRWFDWDRQELLNVNPARH